MGSLLSHTLKQCFEIDKLKGIFIFTGIFLNRLQTQNTLFIFVNFVCFVALCPKSTAMVLAGRSDHLTTLFPV